MRRTKRRAGLVFSVAAMWLGLALAASGASPAYVCQALKQAPVVDGRVAEDPAWQGIAAGGAFQDMRTGLPSAKQTAFQLGYSEETLFIGIICQEAAPDSLRASLPDGEVFWGEDYVSLYLVPGAGVPAVFHVNAMGSLTSAQPPGSWQAATHVGENAWSVEIALPWEVLGAAPEAGASWRLNVCRHIASRPLLEHSTWAPVQHSAEDLEDFGTLGFGALEPAMRDAIEARIRTHVLPAEGLVYSQARRGVMLDSGYSTNRIVYNQGPHVAPRLSPEGNRILYNSKEGGAMGVWLVDRSGLRKERLCDGAQAAWSPGGHSVVFQREGRLIERRIATGEEVVISPAGVPPLAFPDYVPGNGASRFVCTDEGGRYLCLLSPGAEPPLEVLAEGDIEGAPRSSPDGTWLAFARGAHISVLELATRDVRQASTEPGVQAWPVWSSDGRSLLYAWSPAPCSSMWDIHHIDLAAPATVHVVERRVHAAFDWLGTSVNAGRAKEMLGTRLELWRGDTPFDLSKGPEPESQDDWERLENLDVMTPLSGNLLLANDWLGLLITPAAISVIPWAEGQALQPMALRLGAENGGTGRVSLVEQTGDHVTLALCASGSTPGDLLVKLRRTRPVVEVQSREGPAVVTVDSALSCVVVPDRYANDLIVTPQDAGPGAAVVLPETSLVLGCLPDGGAMVMLAAPNGDACFQVTRKGDETFFGSLTAEVKARKIVALTVLMRGPLWEQPKLAAGAGEGKWTAEWKRPFSAEWRMAVRGGEGAFSRTWNTDDLAKQGRGPLPIAASFTEEPEDAIFYTWSRDVLTPADILTPADVLLDVLGIKGYLEDLDEAGIRGWRSGDQPVAFRELAAHDAAWHPAKADWQDEAFGILEVMGSVFPAGTGGVRSLLTHLGGDAINLLESLDLRIGEYETGLQDLATFCQSHSQESEALEALAQHARAALDTVHGARRMDIAKASLALEDVVALVGKRENIKVATLEAFSRLPGNEEWAEIYQDFLGYLAAREGRLWHDGTIRFELWYEDDFKTFARRCRSILAQRQRGLAQCRTAVQQIRDLAARQIVTDPAFKPIGDELRRRTRAILRNRFYLEGDWHGETPLGNGDAP